MTSLKWWLRIVGAFYLLLTLMNLWFLFFNPKVIGDQLPFPANDLTIRAFSDAWLTFILELGVIGAMMMYAARDPAKSIILVQTVIALEVVRGILDDIYLIARGYDLGGYLAFIVLHLIIIVTGVLFLRRAVVVAGSPERRLPISQKS